MEMVTSRALRALVCSMVFGSCGVEMWFGNCWRRLQYEAR